MAKHNLLKKLSISIASLALICPLALGGLNNTNVNARRRRPRTHRVYRHHRRTRRTRARRVLRKGHHARRTHKNRKRHTVKRVARKHIVRRARRHHESQATWYKNNAVNVYYHNRFNHAFKVGYKDGHHGFEDNTAEYISRNNMHNKEYKYGWIIGSTRMDVDPDNYSSARYDLKTALRFHYNGAISMWNGGIHYLNTHPQAQSTQYDATTWDNADNY